MTVRYLGYTFTKVTARRGDVSEPGILLQRRGRPDMVGFGLPLPRSRDEAVDVGEHAFWFPAGDYDEIIPVD